MADADQYGSTPTLPGASTQLARQTFLTNVFLFMLRIFGGTRS